MSQAELQGVLDSLSLDQLKALQSGNYEGIPAETLQQIQGLTSQSGQNLRPQQAAQAAPPEVPSQRLRSMAQGLTMGGADEMEAYVRSLAGEPYKQAETDVRQKLKAYQQASPYESLAYEAGGAVMPALAMTRATGGTAAPAAAFAPLMARAAGVGALQGGTTGFATGEGDIFERLSRMPQGMLVGGVAGPVGTAVMSAGGGLANKLVDFARRSFGGRGSKAVETEVQRLATESGLTTDELVQRIASGEIMAENATLQAAVRGLYTQGGKAATTIRGGLTQRPTALRAQAVEQMRKGLAPSGDKNILRQQKMTEDEIVEAEKVLYGKAYEEGGIISPPLLQSFADTLKSSKDAAKAISEYYTLTTRGKSPFFKVMDDGTVEYSRTPTIEDMEIVRRGLKQEADKAYRSNATASGGVLSEMERELKAGLNVSSPALQKARQTAFETRTASESFREGRKAFAKSADQVALEFELMTPLAQKAYRSGLMDAVRNKMSGGSRKSMMGNFADETSKEGQILRSVFKQDQLPALLQSVQTAAGSQRAATKILGGSDTASSMQQSKRIGMNISAEEVTQAVGGDPIAGYRVLKKFIFKNAGNLSEAERDQVAKILVSTDPKLLRNALVDESQMAKLQDLIRRIAYRASVGVPGGVTQIGAGRIQPTQEQR